MLKKEPFKQVRHSLAQLEAICSRASGQGKQRSGALRSTIHQRLSQHTGKVMLLMSIVLIVGTVSLMLKRQPIGSRKERLAAEQLLNSTKRVGHALSQPIISGMGQWLDMLTLGDQLEQIIHKDSLTSADSAFLWQLNAYLNKDSFFQAYPRWTSPRWTYPPVDTARRASLGDTPLVVPHREPPFRDGTPPRRTFQPNDSINQIP